MLANADPNPPAQTLEAIFEIGGLLKSGNGIDTLRARERKTGLELVLRTSSRALVSPGAWMRLEHDAAALSVARGSQLARVLSFGRTDELVYVARPFVAGETLAERLLRGPLPPLETARLARDLLAELCAIHAQGVLHRDLKPSNIILGTNELVLVDFGLVRSERLGGRSAEDSAALARYFSPEQAGLLEHAVDERSDLYALGLVVYECLAGKPPFTASTVSEMLRLHLSAAPPPLADGALPIPRVLEEMTLRLLQKDPRDRYQSAAAALSDAEEIADQLAVGIAEPTVVLGLADARTSLLEPAFVGRAQELESLERQIGRAAGRAGGLAVVEAESGGGKTRFLDELARRSVRGGAWLLRGQGLDQGAQRPFQMLAGVVAEVIARTRAEPAYAERLRTRVGEQAEALQAAIPELRALFSDEAPDQRTNQLGDEQHGETRSLEALGALLDALGEPGRTAVILLDDCQWADEPTLKLLAQNQRRRAAAHLIIVVAYRSEAVIAPHPLRSLRSELHLILAPFATRQVHDLARSMAGALPEEALRIVEELAEGSPFMASAVLRGLVESGALVSDRSGWRIEPAAMADLRASHGAAGFLTRRLELLPARALELLTVGAVLGKQFDLEAVGALCGLTAAALLPAIAEARARHIVWRRGDSTCSFVHDKLRESLLSRLSSEERAALHKKAALYLEVQPGEHAFEIAFHFDAAGDAARALPFALAAAKSARARFALDLAERQYRIAARGAEQADATTRLSIAEGLGDVLLLRGSYEDAESQLKLAASLAPGDLRRAQLEGKLGVLAFKRGDMRTAAARLEGALVRLGKIAPKRSATFFLFLLWEIGVQALHTWAPRWTIGRKNLAGAEREMIAIRLYSRLAYLYWFQRGQVPTLWAHLREMNLAERYPPTPELAQAYSEHAPVMSMVPMFARGLRYAERSLEIRRSLGDIWGQGQSLHFIGVVLYAASRIRECMDRCREAVRLLRRTGDLWEVNTASWHIAFCHYRLGELGEASARAQEVWQAGVEIGDLQASGISLGVWAKASGGKVPQAALEAELLRPSEDVHTAAEILTAQAALLLREGKPAEAVRALEAAQKKIDNKGLKQEYVAAVLPSLLVALLREAATVPAWSPKRRDQVLKRARQVAKRALPLARVYRNNLPHALRGCAELLALRGKPEQARRLLDESVLEASKLEARAEEASSRKLRAQLGRAEGWPGFEEDETRAMQLMQREPGALGELRDEDTQVTLSLSDRFRALLEAGRQIATALAPTEIEAAVERAANRLLRTTGYQLVHLVDGRAEGLQLSLAERSLVNEALQRGGPVIRVANTGAGDLPANARCALCAPVLVRGVARAAFIATHSQVSLALGEEEQRLAAFIATLAGAALENGDGIGQLQRVERDLAMAEKMAALGTLAAGVAHEINNPLSYLLTNLDFIPAELRDIFSRKEPLDAHALDEVMQALFDAREGAERVSDIVRDLRVYSSPEEAQPQAVDVLRALEAMITLAKAELRHRAQLVRSLSPVPHVVAAESRLGQVFLNLLINAAQSIPEGNSEGNEVRVITRTDGDGFAVIEISDTGSGIAPEIRERIFDPFFTTKPVGVGTGLGLSICQGIVRGLGGEISVESVVGKGSTFRVRLPPAPPDARPARLTLVPKAIGAQRLRILVIDDEPAIGVALARILSEHTVEVETRGRDALARIGRGDRFDAVLCDLMMPEMNGMEVFAELTVQAPLLASRLAFISGGAVTLKTQQFLQQTANEIFDKPIDPVALREFLARITPSTL